MYKTLVLAAVAALAISCARPDPYAAERHRIASANAAQAKTALALHDYARARIAADAAAQADPLDPAMQDLALRVRLTQLAQSPQTAAVHDVQTLEYQAEMLQKRDPAHLTDYLLAQGELELATGDDQAAEKLFAQAEKRPDAGAPALLAMGRLESKRGQHEKALQSFQAALKKDPKSTDALTAVGGEEILANKPDDAAKVLEQAVSHPDATALAHRLYGLALYSQKKVPQAGQELVKAVQMDPKDGLSQHALGDYWLQTGQLARAEAAYQNASKLGAEPEATFGLAQVAARAHQDAKAAQLFAAVAKSSGGSLESAYLAGMEFDRAGQAQAAAQWLNAYVGAAARDPSEAPRVQRARSVLAQLTQPKPAAPAPHP